MTIDVRTALVKVPPATALFWIIKVLTTGMGETASDFLAHTLIFAAAIAVPALLFRAGRLGPVAAFWTAYVITRPLGASFADWMGVDTARGGLGLGTGPVTLAWAAVIAALVGYLAVTRADAEQRAVR